MPESEYVRRSRSKALQITNRYASEKRGTNGRPEHKGKARSTNKKKGGKMAR